MLELHRFRLGQMPITLRLVTTGFVTMALVGYMVALLNMFLTYAGADGKPGLTPADVKLKLHGDRNNTRLEAAITTGNMRPFVKTEAERQQILDWIHAGATQKQFAGVQPIFNKSCVGCHSSSGVASFRPLTSYEGVAAVAQVDRGESLEKFARTAHVHLQSLAFLYFLLGALFAFCRLPELLKALVASTPFGAMVLDFGARGLAPHWPEMVYVMMAGGGLAAGATTLMVLAILWELWVPPRAKAKKPAEAPGLAVPAAS